jgi:hypothetical protein
VVVFDEIIKSLVALYNSVKLSQRIIKKL